MAERKIYESKEKLIEFELSRLKETLDSNLDKLPNYELPFMEPHLRGLYFEAYFLLAYGFYNASLVLCGILLESLVKQRLFMEGIKDEELEKINFGQALAKCKKFLTPDEISYLEIKIDKLRNPYAHYNMMKLSKGVPYIGFEIKNPVEKIINLLEKVGKGELTEAQARLELIKGVPPKTMTSEDFRPLAHIAKNRIEEEGLAVSVFLDIDKFARDFAVRYFKTV